MRMPASGLLISCATEAASLPSDDIFSDWISCACASAQRRRALLDLPLEALVELLQVGLRLARASAVIALNEPASSPDLVGAAHAAAGGRDRPRATRSVATHHLADAGG